MPTTELRAMEDTMAAMIEELTELPAGTVYLVISRVPTPDGIEFVVHHIRNYVNWEVYQLLTDVQNARVKPVAKPDAEEDKATTG
jgi:hypothetical protein